MNSRLKEIIEEFCEENEYEYRGDYSGRCMFGRTCVGIVFDTIKYSDVLLKLDKHLEEYDYTVDDLGSYSVDSMGLGTILYFSHLQ